MAVAVHGDEPQIEPAARARARRGALARRGPASRSPRARRATTGVGFVDTLEGRAALRSAHALAARANARLRVPAAVQRRSWIDGPDEDELRLRAENATEAAASGLLVCGGRDGAA
jgi:hypothetical protein